MLKKKLINFNQALNLSKKDYNNYYKNHINKGLHSAFKILGYNSLDIKSAKDCYINLRNGKKILDFTSSIGVLVLGHNNQKLQNIENKFNKLNIIESQKFGDNKLQAALAYNLSRILPGNLNRCFFAVSGAESVEAALKISKMVRPNARYIWSFKNSYHGKTAGALSVTNAENFSNGFFLGIPKKNLINSDFNDEFEFEQKIKKYGAKNICAVILEPIQGQNIEVASKKFVKKINLICKKNNITLIYDEIKSGLGRSGDLFSFYKTDTTPDILTVSKALGGGKNPISAMICTDKIFNKAYGSIKKSTIHTTTFFGLGKGCATAIETLNIITEKKFLKDLKFKSNYFKEKLLYLKNKYPKIINDVLGEGFFLGLDFNFGFITKIKLLKINIPFIGTYEAIMMGSIVREYLTKHNILLHFSNSNPSRLVIMPPLVAKKKDIDKFIYATELILNKGILKIFSSFILGNISQINK